MSGDLHPRDISTRVPWNNIFELIQKIRKKIKLYTLSLVGCPVILVASNATETVASFDKALMLALAEVCRWLTGPSEQRLSLMYSKATKFNLFTGLKGNFSPENAAILIVWARDSS